MDDFIKQFKALQERVIQLEKKQISSLSLTDLDISNILKVDTINEHTAAHGVIIDGVTIKDNIVDAPSGLKGDTVSEHTSAAGVTIDGILLKDSVLALPNLGAAPSALASNIELYARGALYKLFYKDPSGVEWGDVYSVEQAADPNFTSTSGGNVQTQTFTNVPAGMAVVHWWVPWYKTGSPNGTGSITASPSFDAVSYAYSLHSGIDFDVANAGGYRFWREYIGFIKAFTGGTLTSTLACGLENGPSNHWNVGAIGDGRWWPRCNLTVFRR